MPNIYQNISKNKQETVVIMVLFVAIVSFLGWLVGKFYFDGSGTFFIGLALIFSGISAFISYYNSDKMVLALSGAVELDPEQNRDLYHVVENVCIAAGLPLPKIYIIEDSAMNAFATGRDPEHSVICFTTGMISSLEKRELEGVTAHELSHIGNYDIRLMSIVSVLVGTVTLLADWFTRGMFYGKRSRSNNSSELSGIILIFGLIFMILSPIIATFIKLAVSRNREYLADSSAALITRYPAGLASALRKLSQDQEILEAANGATAHLYISNPLRSDLSGKIAQLFNTHPPIEERIRRLESM